MTVPTRMSSSHYRIQSVTVYGGSRTPNADIFSEHAFELGKLIAEQGWVQVNGGGCTGLMRRMTEGAQSVGGVVDAVTVGMFDSEDALPCYRNRVLADSMPERKAGLYQRGDALVALPGGIGTLDELIEVICLRHLSLHSKPIVLIDSNGFYKGLMQFFQTCVESQFIPSTTVDMVHIADTPKDAIQYLQTYSPVDLRKTPSGVMSGEMEAMKRKRASEK